MAVERIFGEGTDYDVSATTVFRPAMTKLVLQSGSTWPIDEQGVTTLRRKWKCRRDLALKFLPRRGDRDFLFRNLRVIQCDPVDDGALTTFDVLYNGFIDGIVPEKLPPDDQVEQIEATLHAGLVNGVAEGSITVVYLAPTRVTTWASDKQVLFDKPYASDITFQKPPQVLYIRQANGIQLEGNTAAFLKKIQFEIRAVRKQFRSAPDGFVFRNSETVQRQFIQAAHFDSPQWLKGINLT